MKQAARQIAICAAGLLLLCLICRLTVFRTYTISMHMYAPSGGEVDIAQLSLDVDRPEILDCGAPQARGDLLRVPVHPQRAGDATITIFNQQNGVEYTHLLTVDRLLTVYDFSSGGFTGDAAVLIAVTLFWLLVSAVMLWHFFRARGAALYSYSTIYFAGFFLFALSTGMVMLTESVRHFMQPGDYPMISAYRVLNSASKRFMFITLPLIVLFAVAMAVSNIALLRHEKPRFQNVLGLLVSLLLIVGEALGIYLFSRDFSGSEWAYRVQNTFENTYATIFIYFECMLAGSVICGIRSARYEPRPDKDFIIILGCWFRRDGSLPPLIRGRVDRAIQFWKKQKSATGREAVLIPSGGQGKNETMPEAEAMRRYLVSQGIPEHLIVKEDQSANTYQNMAFSKAIIERQGGGKRTVFSTTNYHVFRSGVWAHLAGLPAEGIGSKTKWWFWPNAFMRECVGLLQNRWHQEILFLLVLIAFFSVLSLLLG